jgi:hypothetical protein
MAETQSSSLSGTIFAKFIENVLISYQYDNLTITPYFRQGSIVDMATTTLAFAREVKSTGPTAGTPASEVTALGTTAFTTTSVDIAVGRVGIAREVTETAKEDSVIGRALDVSFLVADAAKLYGEYFDTASADLFSTVTATVGSTGTALTIPTMIDAIGSQRRNKAQGVQVISLHDNQATQLQKAQAESQSTPWATFFSPSQDGGQFCGYFLNAPVWASGLNETSTGDRLGAIWSQGQVNPKFCAFAFVIKRLPSSKTETNILMDSDIWASFARSGCGVVANNFATAIRSVNA